ncbi:MAG: hypothetical protein ACNA7U_03650 [Candidatus Izemoplasmataceae bacterium]
MCDWDIVTDLMDYTSKVYPEIDIREPNEKIRKRMYERIIIDEVLETCFDRMFNDPITIIEDYLLLHEWLDDQFNIDIYKFQLDVIKDMLDFLKKREEKYG